MALLSAGLSRAFHSLQPARQDPAGIPLGKQWGRAGMGKNLAGHKCHGHRGGRGKEPFWGRAQDHFGSREVLAGLLGLETPPGFRAKASWSVHSWSYHGALGVEHTWRSCHVKRPWVLKTRHGRRMGMPLVGQVSHWGGSEQKCCCFPSRAEYWAPGLITGMSWCDLQREAQEWLTQAAVPS